MWAPLATSFRPELADEGSNLSVPRVDHELQAPATPAWQAVRAAIQAATEE